ncbi:hypothetical protein LguiA_001574 [Lonicera macranthoides]
MSFLYLLVFSSLLPLSLSQAPRGSLIDCGATGHSVIDGRDWLPDTGFIESGTSKTLNISGIVPILSTVRSFPLQGNVHRKFCYVVPVFRTGKYLVRTTYYYGGINGNNMPPVFDQIVDGTLWSVVNTTEDYVRGMSSYYEGVFVAGGKTMSVCLGVNTYTDSDPFISALEFVLLDDGLYNSTDFSKSGLRLVARHSFGHDGPIIRYPDDQFDRFWEPFTEDNPTKASVKNVSVSGFWNIPPLEIFQTAVTSDRPEPIEFQWPPAPLPNSTYYIALYFANNRDTGVPRVFNLRINDVIYYHDLTVIPAGVAVFANEWPLGGLTKLTLTPIPGSSFGPLINGGEVFEVLPLGGRTLTRDAKFAFLCLDLNFLLLAIAMENLKNSFQNLPLDWNGDPCLPRQYSWTGVTCSNGSRIRVIALNLTNMGLTGSLSPRIARMSALTDIWLGNNNLTGSLPDLSPLKRLETLHLEDNHLSGEIPSSLGSIDSLRELFLQGNNMTGQVPSSLVNKPGLNLRINPGNPLLSPPQS